MTKPLMRNGKFIKFELDGGWKDRFAAACARMDISQAEAMRVFVEQWTLEVETPSGDGDAD